MILPLDHVFMLLPTSFATTDKLTPPMFPNLADDVARGAGVQALGCGPAGESPSHVSVRCTVPRRNPERPWSSRAPFLVEGGEICSNVSMSLQERAGMPLATGCLQTKLKSQVPEIS